jgi:hypothetical protein
MICKGDICESCIRRRKRNDCGFEPEGWGPDRDGEYSVGCNGELSETIISDSAFYDALEDYHGIGDPIPWSILYPLLIWYGMNWLGTDIVCG